MAHAIKALSMKFFPLDTNKHRSALPERAGHFSDLEIIHEKE